MIQLSKIVHIDAKAEPPKPPVPEFIVLRNKTLRQIRRVARENPGVWIYPFCTGKVKAVPNYCGFQRRGKPEDSHILRPFYVGNLRPVEDAIKGIVLHAFGPDAIERKP